MLKKQCGWITILCMALFAAFSHAAGSSVGKCPESGNDIACTKQGAIRGVAQGSLLAFKGIPYARPPVGNLRWRLPQPPDAWDGVRDGSAYGPMCPQIVANKVVGDEDCLTLNVWRPRALSDKPLPVMV